MPKPLPLTLAALSLFTASAFAQNVYRIVGPDGKVTFSDRPPAVQAPTARTSPAAGPGASGPSLPFELGQIAARYPVTLYTGSECAPCASARNLLAARGIPFTERTITTNEDIEALQRLSGSTSLPFATIGGQQLAGFSDVEWIRYLDAAGYPKQSQLPTGYQRPAPTPLVAVAPAAPAAPAASAAPQRPAPTPARPPATEGPTPSNPAGIRF